MPSDESPSTPGRAAWVGWRRREPPEKACVKGPGRVTFDSRTAEFDTLLGSKPAFEILAEGSAETLGAHEGASYVASHIIFTTKPFEAPTAGATYQGEIKSVNIPTREVTTLWRCPNLANGATTGPDGRLYVCLQGQQATGTLPGVEILAGIFSIDPCDESGRVRRFPDSAWCARLLGGGSFLGAAGIGCRVHRTYRRRHGAFTCTMLRQPAGPLPSPLRPLSQCALAMCDVSLSLLHRVGRKW